jgi:hypothetical protein
MTTWYKLFEVQATDFLPKPPNGKPRGTQADARQHESGNALTIVLASHL